MKRLKQKLIMKIWEEGNSESGYGRPGIILKANNADRSVLSVVRTNMGFKKHKMKEKIIIQNDSDLEITDSMRLVEKVIQQGRVSNEGRQYAYLTAFSIGGVNYHVVTDLNKCSDKFTVYKV